MNEDIVRVRLVLKAETEISCRSDLPARNVYLTDPYPASRAMRGALLSALRASVCESNPRSKCQHCNKRDRCKFWMEVVKDVISVSDLLPSCSCGNGVPIGQAPRTFITCKICEDGAFDATRAFMIEESPSRAVFCKKHDQPYYRRQYTGPVCLGCGNRLAEPSTNMRPLIRLDATTGTVGEGGLFFVETLEYGDTELTLDVTVGGNTIDLVEEAAKNSMLLQVGGGKNRGWGMVRINRVKHRYDTDKYTSLIHDDLQVMIEKNQIVVIARTPIADLTPEMKVIPRVEKIGGMVL
ncbi:MAG: RAMP superfamily CRISPR-associated protein, partial [Candidatus Thorarchaeota archaeon]